MHEQLDPAVGQAIQSLGVTCEVLPCNPDWADTEVFCTNYNIPRDRAANTILVASKTEPKQYAACLVLATTRLDVNHSVRRLLGGQKLSFASGEETAALTGMMMGGVTVFGLPPGLPIYIDGAVLDARSVVVGGGSRSCKIRIAPEALRRIPNVLVVEGLAH